MYKKVLKLVLISMMVLLEVTFSGCRAKKSSPAFDDIVKGGKRPINGVEVLASADKPETPDAYFDVRKENAKLCKDDAYDFAFRVIDSFRMDTDKNFVCSPVTTYLSLAALAEMSEGNTRGQILKALNVSDIGECSDKASQIFYSSYANGKQHKMLPSVSVWIDNAHDYKYNGKVLGVLGNDCHADIFEGQLDSEGSAKAMQDWMGNSTDGKLSYPVENLLNDKTDMVMISALLYRAKWENEFWKGATKPDIFHTKTGDVTCDFMSNIDSIVYLGSNYKAVYKTMDSAIGGRVIFILPDEGVTCDELLSEGNILRFLKADTDYWESNITVKKGCEVICKIPKFEIPMDIDMKAGLAAMGITDVFDLHEADFTGFIDAGINKNTYLNSARQRLKLSIDEEGCEGIAIEVYEFEEYAADEPLEEPERIDFICDRPFILAVEGTIGVPLFMGIIENPSDSAGSLTTHKNFWE